jgi:hypothetical protein
MCSGFSFAKRVLNAEDCTVSLRAKFEFSALEVHAVAKQSKTRGRRKESRVDVVRAANNIFKT